MKAPGGAKNDWEYLGRMTVVYTRAQGRVRAMCRLMVPDEENPDVTHVHLVHLDDKMVPDIWFFALGVDELRARCRKWRGRGRPS